MIYDPEVISFEDLVKHVYRTVDYEDDGGQFCDRSHSYWPAIFCERTGLIINKILAGFALINSYRFRGGIIGVNRAQNNAFPI